MKADVKSREFESGREHCLSREPPGDLSMTWGECPEDSDMAGLVGAKKTNILFVSKAIPLSYSVIEHIISKMETPMATAAAITAAPLDLS